MILTLTALNSLKSESAFAFHHLWQSKGCQGLIYINCPLRLNAPKQHLIGTPAGGQFKDSTGATIDSFLASDYGVGTHLITYTYVDSNGCDYEAKTWVQVTEPPQLSFGFDSTYCIPAYGMAVWAKYDTIEFPNLKYLWSNGDTTKNSRYNCGDTLVLYTYTTDSTCFSIDRFVTELQCCCDLSSSFSPGVQLIYNDENPLNWNGDTLVVDRDIVISGNYSHIIDNSLIIMKCDARIIVTRGATLEINKSTIGECNWEGIEVWGYIDVCSDEWGVTGRLTMDSSIVTCANVGVLSGARDYTNNTLIDIAYLGGVMYLTENHFKGNYVDILFTPDSYLGICKCSYTDGKKMQSSITNNTFDTLANYYICNDFVDPILNDIDQYFNSGGPQTCQPGKTIWQPNDPPPPARCHIIDLSPYIEYYIFLPGSVLNCGDACLRKAWIDSKHNTGLTADSNTYEGRTFNNSIINCDDDFPAKNHE